MLTSVSDADLKLLRVFHTIVVCGGVSQAQPVLNSSQSTISTQLANLEARLGFRLCNRGRRGFSLTKRGRVVHEEAQILFSAIDDFRVRVSESANAIEGELRLGLIEALITHPQFRFRETVRRFCARSSRSSIDLHIESIIDLETMVLDGRLHLAVSFCHHRLPSLNYTEVFSERHFLYCGARHPIFEMQAAAQIRASIATSKYVTRSYLESSVTPPNIEFLPSAKCDNIEGLAMLVLSGEFIAFLPDHFARQWVEAGEMKPILPKQINHDAAFHLIQPKGDRLPNVAAAFIKDFAEEHRLSVTS